MSFHTRLEEILKKGKLSAKDNKDLIKLIKTNGLPYKELLLEAGMNLYLNGQLNNDEAKYQILDAMADAALKSRNWTAYYKIELVLFKAFGRERKLLLQHYGAFKALKHYDNTEKHLSSMVKDNLVDQEAIKNKISVSMAKGEIEEVIEELNEYLKMNPVDAEAWSELADIYLRHQDYSKALFCFEEMLMIVPDNLHIMNKVAEMHYTLGKKDNLKFAKKYFSFVLLKQEHNVRALWGLKYTCQALLEEKEEAADAEVTRKLLALVEECAKKIYHHESTKVYVQ